MVSFDDVERALRRQTFGTLSTLTEQGTPHATGVVYAVSAPDEPLILYVTTRTTTGKVRNIRAHADVAFVVTHHLVRLVTVIIGAPLLARRAGALRRPAR